MIKSPAELALMSQAKAMTPGSPPPRGQDPRARDHHRSGAALYRPGPSGAGRRQWLVVLRGPVRRRQRLSPRPAGRARSLEDGQIVLIDTGCQVQGYNSDITRTYVFGEATPEQRQVWKLEKKAQAAAFAAVKPGVPCEEIDAVARKVLASAGLGPDYELPGLPHRTGHGIGLSIHEAPTSSAATRRRWRLDVLLQRADDRHPRSLRHPAGGSLPCHGGRGGLVHPAAAEPGETLRLGRPGFFAGAGAGPGTPVMVEL